MSDATQVGSAPANPIADPAMPDAEVATAITDAVPGTNVDGKATELGEHVYSAVLTAIKRERSRIQGVVREIAVELVRKAQADAGAAQAASLQGNVRGAREMEARATANNGIGQYLGRFLVLAVALPPGACKKCLGQGRVPSHLAPGQLVPCPVCQKPAAPVADGTVEA